MRSVDSLEALEALAQQEQGLRHVYTLRSRSPYGFSSKAWRPGFYPDSPRGRLVTIPGWLYADLLAAMASATRHPNPFMEARALRKFRRLTLRTWLDRLRPHLPRKAAHVVGRDD